MTKHEELLTDATKAILAVYTDDSVAYDISRESLIELENLCFRLITDIESRL